jgi:predicted transcriptional regulator of viral defense system
MTIQNLNTSILTPLFRSDQVRRVFDDELASQINVQLSRMEKRGELIRLKNGVYQFANREVDVLTIATHLYQPTYVSLETALSIYGILPETPSQVTSVGPITTKELKTVRGVFSYSKIQSALYFGFEKLQDSYSSLYYNLAYPEKALLDYVYIRQISDLSDYRLDLESINLQRLDSYAKLFPSWVGSIIRKQINHE